MQALHVAVRMESQDCSCDCQQGFGQLQGRSLAAAAEVVAGVVVRISMVEGARHQVLALRRKEVQLMVRRIGLPLEIQLAALLVALAELRTMRCPAVVRDQVLGEVAVTSGVARPQLEAR